MTNTSVSLLEAMRGSGDVRAWEEFFRRYGPMLLSFARRGGLGEADAQDAVQETLLAVHRAFSKMTDPFDRGKGTFKAWLRGIARHKVQEIRRRRARQERRDTLPAKPVAYESELDALFDAEWRLAMLSGCLEQVSQEVDPAVFQAFELYAVHGKAVGEVAGLLGVTRNAVYISKTRVLKRMREVIRERIEADG